MKNTTLTLDAKDDFCGSEFAKSSAKPSDFLISNYQERSRRAQEKKTEVLRFLRDEIWTMTDVISKLLGIGYPASLALLKRMKEEGLINSEERFIQINQRVRRAILYGITSKGLAYAWHLDEEPESRNPWEPSKTNVLFVPHQIETQLTRLKALSAGWSEWSPSRCLMGLGLPKIPDAEAVSPEGSHVAIEIEREIKSDKRYQAIIGAYISQFKKDGRWERIDYVCPSEDFAQRLVRIFIRLKVLRLETPRLPSKVGPLQQVHLDKFRFYQKENWPDGEFFSAQLPSLGNQQ